MDSGFLVIRPELFENESVELEIAERILQIGRESVTVKVVSFSIIPSHLSRKEMGVD